MHRTTKIPRLAILREERSGESSNAALVPLAASADLARVSSFPTYDRAALECGIGHLGLGNFHRSHLAWITHTLLQTQPGNWMIYGVCMLDSELPFVAAMERQDNLYTLTERSANGDILGVVGSIKVVAHGPSATARVIDDLAADNITIISLTVTEKGYCSTSAGDLDLAHPMIVHDLAADSAPVSVFGYLHAVATQRLARSGRPFTVVSCDNLPGNGDIAGRLLLQFADLKDPVVADWIRANVSFPNSMVDRITPVVTADTVSFIYDVFGIDDNCPVVCEPFWQWVIEDDFANVRPAWETVGVQFVRDVRPYEILKTRMLNGAHSALAYPAYLMGHRRVDEAMCDPLILEYVTRYMDDDVTPTVPSVPGIDLSDYKQMLLTRFANPQISDQVERLAKDGSTKIRTFIVPPLTEQLERGGSITWLCFAIACWCRYIGGRDDNGDDIVVDDPLSSRLQDDLRTSRDLVTLPEVFGDDILANPRFLAETGVHDDAIRDLGTRGALERLLRNSGSRRA